MNSGILLSWMFVCAVAKITIRKSISGSEYCQWENFVGTCQADHVILITEAKYGRLRLGRCVKKEYGYIGCSADVTPFMDMQCGGKTECDVTVADISLQGVRPCPGDLTSFLIVSYQCIKVPKSIIGQETSCNIDKPVVLYTQSGFLPGTDTDCSFLLSAAQGRRFNLTLYDFGQMPMHQETQGVGRMFCQRYATVRDQQHPHWSNVCGGSGHRISTVFVSDTNEVEVRILARRAGHRDHGFVLHYKTFGCPTPSLPPYMHTEQQNDNLMVTCPGTDDGPSRKWHLQCVNDEWVGDVGNCSSASPAVQGPWDDLAKEWSSPTGIAIVVVFGVALGVTIGASSLAMAYICIKRDKRCGRKQETAEIYMDPVKPDTQPAQRLSLNSAAFLEQDDYADVWCARTNPDQDNQIYRSLDKPVRCLNSEMHSRSTDSVVHCIDPHGPQPPESGPTCAVHGLHSNAPRSASSATFIPHKPLRVAVGQRRLANVDLVQEVSRDIVHHVNCRAGHAWQFHGGGDGRYDLPPHENIYMFRTLQPQSPGVLDNTNGVCGENVGDRAEEDNRGSQNQNACLSLQ